MDAHKEIRVHAEHGLSVDRPGQAGAPCIQCLARLSPGCHQASYPLSLAKGPPGGCRQEITRGGLWAWNGRLPRPALPAGMFPSSEFSGLDWAGRAATLHKGRGRHSRGMLRAHLGWFSSYLRVSLSHFLS